MQSAETTPVLFLDADWRPLSVRPLKRAMKKIVNGTVEVIEHSRDKTIRSETERHPMPSVVRVLRKFKRERIAIKFSRLNIYTRDNFTCQFCGKGFVTEDLTFDHVIPRSQGGRTCWENIVAACVECNKRKADRKPEEVGMRLLRKPIKPRYLPMITVQMDRRHVPPEWIPYWQAVLEP